MNGTIIKSRKHKKVYGKLSAAYTALENVSFDIHEGEFVGIMGPFRSGKINLAKFVSNHRFSNRRKDIYEEQEYS